MKKPLRLWLCLILFSLMTLMCSLPEAPLQYIVGYPTVDPILIATRAQEYANATLEAMVKTLRAEVTPAAVSQPTAAPAASQEASLAHVAATAARDREDV